MNNQINNSSISSNIYNIDTYQMKKETLNEYLTDIEAQLLAINVEHSTLQKKFTHQKHNYNIEQLKSLAQINTEKNLQLLETETIMQLELQKELLEYQKKFTLLSIELHRASGNSQNHVEPATAKQNLTLTNTHNVYIRSINNSKQNNANKQIKTLINKIISNILLRNDIKLIKHISKNI